MARPHGGWVSGYAAPSLSAARGVWSLRDTYIAQRAGTWSAVDPYRSSVLCLLHMEGTNGSTTFTDTSPSPKTITAVGNAQISTAQAKFGVSSGLFDGSGDWLSIPTISLPGQFTVEMFVRWNAAKNYAVLVAGTTANTQLFITRKADGSGLRWGLTGVVEYGNCAFTWSNNVWYHVALVRSSTAYLMFVDGTQIGSSTGNLSQSFSGTMELCGSGANNFEPNAYIDEFRVTTAARYDSSFTAPTAPFPDR